MEPDGDSEPPPFWFRPPTDRRRRQPSPLVNPVALILAIPILILLLLFFIVPPFVTHTNQILKPNSVKRSWDSFNVLLVLFAVLCGVFARRNDGAPPSDDGGVRRQNSGGFSNASSSFVNRPITTSQSVSTWLDFPDRNVNAAAAAAGGRLRRNASSYPDLRQESLWESEGGNRSRFFDDFDVNFYRPTPPPPEKIERRRPRRSHEMEREEGETTVREIPVDKFEISSAPPEPPKSPAAPLPPPPPPSTVAPRRRRSVRSVPRRENIERRSDDAEISENRRSVPPPAPPPPPPPPLAALPEIQISEEIIEKIPQKKTVTTKEIATAIASLYNGKRKRNKRVQNRNIYDSAAAQNSSPPSSALEPQSAAPPAPPPPPPPPPPSTVLQNLFKKSGKSKRVHSVLTTAPPPPPPPPPNSIFNNLFKTGSSKSKRFEQSSSTAPPPPPPPPPPSSILNSLFKNGGKSRRFSKNAITSPPPAPPPPPPPEPPRRRQINTGKPPLPTKPSAQYHESTTIAPPSPLIPLPPPPPPFRMKATKFIAQGDFVRIHSENSSRCSSPEPEDADDVMSVKSADGIDSTGGGPTITCPSPDVNTKADNFIARLRDEWRLEKMHSMKDKRI